MTSVAEVLEKAADLIEPEGKWARGDFARNRFGEEWSECGEYSRGPFCEWDASCFCIFGAVAYAAGATDPENYRDADGILAKVLGVDNSWDVARWNDNPKRTQAEVVSKLREAAQLAREQGA